MIEPPIAAAVVVEWRLRTEAELKDGAIQRCALRAGSFVLGGLPPLDDHGEELLGRGPRAELSGCHSARWWRDRP